MVDIATLPSTALLCTICKKKVATFSDASVQCQLPTDISQDSQLTFETEISTKAENEFKESPMREQSETSRESPRKVKRDSGSNGSNSSRLSVSEHEEVSPEASVCAPAVAEKEEIKEEISFVSRSFENAEPPTKAAKKWRWGVSKILKSKKKGPGSNVSTPSPILRGGVRRKSLTAAMQEDKEQEAGESSRKTSMTRSPVLSISGSLKSPAASKVEDVQDGGRSDVYEEIVAHSKRKLSNESDNLKLMLEMEKTDELRKPTNAKLSVKSDTLQSEGKQYITVQNHHKDSEDINISQEFDKIVNKETKVINSGLKESSSVEVDLSDKMPEDNKAKDNSKEKENDVSSSEDEEESRFIKKVTESFSSIFKREDSESSISTSSERSIKKDRKKKGKKEKRQESEESGDDDKTEKTEAARNSGEDETSERTKKKEKEREKKEGKDIEQSPRSINNKEKGSEDSEVRKGKGEMTKVLHKEGNSSSDMERSDKHGIINGDFKMEVKADDCQSRNVKVQDEMEDNFVNSSRPTAGSEKMSEENTKHSQKEEEGEEEGTKLHASYSLLEKKAKGPGTVEQPILMPHQGKSISYKVAEESHGISVRDNANFRNESTAIYAQVQKKNKDEVDEKVAKEPSSPVGLPHLENYSIEKHFDCFPGQTGSTEHEKIASTPAASQIATTELEFEETKNQEEFLKSGRNGNETGEVKVSQKDKTSDQNYRTFNWKENETLLDESSLAPGTKLSKPPINGIKDVKIVSVVHEKSPHKTTALSESFCQLKTEDNRAKSTENGTLDPYTDSKGDQITRAIASLRQKRNLKRKGRANIRMVKGKGKLRPIIREEKEKKPTIVTEVTKSQTILDTSLLSEKQEDGTVSSSTFHSKKARLREVRVGVAGGTPKSSRKDGHEASTTTDEDSANNATRNKGFSLRFFTQRQSPNNSTVDDESLTSMSNNSIVEGHGFAESENPRAGIDYQGFSAGKKRKKCCRNHVKTEQGNLMISNGKKLATFDGQEGKSTHTNVKTMHAAKGCLKISENKEDLNFKCQRGKVANTYRSANDTYSASGQSKSFDKYAHYRLWSNATQSNGKGMEDTVEDSSLSGLEDEEWALKGTTFLEILKAMQEEDKEERIQKGLSESTVEFVQPSKYDCKAQQTKSRRLLPVNEGVKQNVDIKVESLFLRETQNKVEVDDSINDYSHKQGEPTLSCADSVSSTDERMRKEYKQVCGKTKVVTWSDRLQETESDSSEAFFDLRFVQRLKEYKMRNKNDQERARLIVQNTPSINSESDSSSSETIVYQVSSRQPDVIQDDNALSSPLDEDEVQRTRKDQAIIEERELKQTACSKENEFRARLRQAKEENRDIASQIYNLRSKAIQRKGIVGKYSSSSDQESTSTIVQASSPDFSNQNGGDANLLVTKQQSHSPRKPVPAFSHAGRLEHHLNSSEQTRFSKHKSSRVEDDSEIEQELESTMDATYHDDIMEHLTLQSSKLVNGTGMKASNSHDRRRMIISIKKPNEKDKILLKENNKSRTSNLEEKDDKAKSKGFKVTSLYVH